ncbi:MAG: ATP-binding protein [Gammaproteobacteria bacterium]|jgi:nitrogen fixation/metabolism regulation signal transduction histidine kinase
MSQVTLLLKRISDSFFPVLAMGLFLVLSLSLLSAATENSLQFGRLHLVLVVINALGLIVLVGLIGVNFIRMIRNYRRNVVGSRLTARLVIVFVILAVAPVSVVYYFSLGFLQRGIDSWFNVRVEGAMEDALELSRASLDLRIRELLKQTRGMAENLSDVPDATVLLNLNDLRSESNAYELTLLTDTGRVIASSSADTTAIIPSQPDDVILSQVRSNKSYAGLAPVGDLGLQIRVAVALDSFEAPAQQRVLYALYPVADRISLLADSVQSAYSQHKELVYLREPLKNSFTLTLSLVLLVSLLTAIWAAFFSAQRLVAPVRVLAVGTRAVAAGNYDKKLPVTSNDELGSLVQSFSDMTNKISLARDEAQRSKEQVEQERAYLRAVLGRLSSGVLTLDRDLKIRVANSAASQILEIDMDRTVGSRLKVVQGYGPHLKEFVDVLKRNLMLDQADWHEQVTVRRRRGNRILICRGAILPSDDENRAGYVVVFDDVTNLVQAQREAAWGEVARRLAHEIKNPLTPIQLSAERLRKKYLNRMKPEDAEVLERSTHTIVQQVEAMKEMVKAFSEYARVPKLQLQPLDIETLINEVMDLYRDDESDVKFTVSIDSELPPVKADAGRIRQLLHNLIKNAIESTRGRKDAKILISVEHIVHAAHDLVELRIVDNGPGIPDQMIENLFEPYTTTKTKGGGLGLAVVKRIVEEHSGTVFAENRHEGGACIVVRLPVSSHDTGDNRPDNLRAQA